MDCSTQPLSTLPLGPIQTVLNPNFEQIQLDFDTNRLIFLEDLPPPGFREPLSFIPEHAAAPQPSPPTLDFMDDILLDFPDNSITQTNEQPTAPINTAPSTPVWAYTLTPEEELVSTHIRRSERLTKKPKKNHFHPRPIKKKLKIPVNTPDLHFLEKVGPPTLQQAHIVLKAAGFDINAEIEGMLTLAGIV